MSKQDPQPLQRTWDASAAPSEPGARTVNTLTMLECNDCTLQRLFACLQSDPRVGVAANADPLGTIFSTRELVMNVVGLRVKDTVSNRFDDRMVVFYRPIDLDGPAAVHDPASPALRELNVPAIEAFLASASPGARLKATGEELPGEPSVDKNKKECRLHSGWKILKYAVTTDPGHPKKPDPSRDVPVGPGGAGYLAQGRGVLQPGRYVGSHHLGLHHGGQLKGFVAMTQVKNVTLRRGFTARHLVDELKGFEHSWEKEFRAFRKKHPSAVESESEWVASRLAARVGAVMEVRESSLTGPVIGNSVTVDHSLERVVKDPKRPTVLTWVLTVRGLRCGARALVDGDVIVLASTGVFGINLHSSNQDPASPSPGYDPAVGNWSEGCQVYRGMADFEQFRSACALSKRARCSRRRPGASAPCPSMKEPRVTLEDVLFLQFADDDARKGYLSTRLTTTPEERAAAADAMLRAKLVGGDLDAEFVECLQRRVDALTYPEDGGAGAVPSPRPKITPSPAGHAARAAALADVVRARLLPGSANDAVRAEVTTAALLKKLESSMQRGLEADAALRAKIDETARPLPPAKRKGVLARADVVALRQQRETAIQSQRLDGLGGSLAALSREVEDRLNWTISRIRASRAEKCAQWNDEGFELCDLLWACEQRIDYTLAEVEKSLVDEVDARY